MGSRISGPKDQSAHPEVSLPIPESLFDRHALGIKIDDLLGR